MGGTVQIFGNNPDKSKFIYEEIKSRLKSGNACYHSVQNHLSSCLLLKNRKMKICRTVILPAFCMGVRLGPHFMEDILWCLRNTERQNVYYLLNTTTFLYIDRESCFSHNDHHLDINTVF